MTSYTTDGTVGPWAEEKLECLSKYLHAYTTIMKGEKWCKGFFYIDAFAGAGKAPLRKSKKKSEDQSELMDLADWWQDDTDNNTYVLGSPYRALTLEIPFSQYLFVEKKNRKASQLADLEARFSNTRKIKVRRGDANEVLLERVVNNQHINWKKHRAVAFLDPFGMQVPWNTLQALASTNAIEAFINFPVGTAIQRYLNVDGKISPERQNQLNDYFGTDSWYDVIYTKTDGLFGETHTEKVVEAGHKLAKWYCSRLKKEFGYVSSARLIRNSNKGHLYYLIFAGPNKTGAKIANHILSQGEIIR